jgi:protoheme ferro-lyase
MTIGVLVMAYGGPGDLDEVEPYLLDVRGGRATSPAFVHEVRERYRQIGGRSPILERTQAQAAALGCSLDGPGERESPKRWSTCTRPASGAPSDWSWRRITRA